MGKDPHRSNFEKSNHLEDNKGLITDRNCVGVLLLVN